MRTNQLICRIAQAVALDALNCRWTETGYNGDCFARLSRRCLSHRQRRSTPPALHRSIWKPSLSAGSLLSSRRPDVHPPILMRDVRSKCPQTRVFPRMDPQSAFQSESAFPSQYWGNGVRASYDHTSQSDIHSHMTTSTTPVVASPSKNCCIPEIRGQTTFGNLLALCVAPEASNSSWGHRNDAPCVLRRIDLDPSTYDGSVVARDT